MDILNGSTLRGSILFRFKHHINHSRAFDVLTPVFLKFYVFQVLRSCQLKINATQSPLLSGQKYFRTVNTEGSDSTVF
jgi:hypothetical protein